MQGAFFGMFIGLLISMMSGGQDLIMTLGSTVLMGAVIWVLFGVIGETLRRRQLKYAIVPAMTAVSYDLVADNAVADQVTSALGPQPQPMRTAAPVAPTPPPAEGPQTTQDQASEQSEASRGIPDLPDGRPQFGVRIDSASETEPKTPPAESQDSEKA